MTNSLTRERERGVWSVKWCFVGQRSPLISRRQFLVVLCSRKKQANKWQEFKWLEMFGNYVEETNSCQPSSSSSTTKLTIIFILYKYIYEQRERIQWKCLCVFVNCVNDVIWPLFYARVLPIAIISKKPKKHRKRIYCNW